MRCSVPLLLLLPGLASGQLPEDPGPEPVGVRSVSFSHALAANNTVIADVFYPALSAGSGAPPNVAGGPYPLVVFLHGYFAPPSFYSQLTEHIASYGFVVAAVGTETGFFQNIQNEAHDAHALLHWVDERGADTQSFLFGLPSAGPWSAVGHSNGVAAIFYALAWEDRIGTVVSTEGNWVQIPTVGQFDGDFLSIGSSEDFLAPAAQNARRYYQDAHSTTRRAYALIQGGGHNGSLDFPTSFHSLSHSEQHRLHRRLVTGFLRAQVQRDEDVYVDLLGAGMAGEPVAREAVCVDPPLWIAHDGGQPGTLTAGLAARPGEAVFLAWARRPDAQALGFGAPGLSGFVFHSAFVQADGLAETSTPLPAALSGLTLTVRGLRDSGLSWAWTRSGTLQVP